MTKLPPATMLGTEVRRVKSRATGKTYQISIALPYAYFGDPTSFGMFDRSVSAWPVVYLLDANWYFGMATDIVRTSAWCGRTTDAIVVGIGYPAAKTETQTWRNVVANRQEDLTPTRDEKVETENTEWLKQPVKTGGGMAFLTFLTQELIPLVDREHRTDPARRILAGHSLGGLIAIHAMFQDPMLFRSYAALSPSLWWAQRHIFGMEAEFAKKHKRLPARLFMSMGELEEDSGTAMVSNLYQMAAQLDSRNYKSFSLARQVFVDHNHCEVAAPAFQAGLKWALAK